MLTRLLTFLCVMGLTSCWFSGSGGKSSNSTATLNGQATYQDRMYNDKGFIASNTPTKPIRSAMVMIVTEQGEILASTVTDGTGAFQFQNVAVGDVYLRVSPWATHASGTKVQVLNINNFPYGVEQEISLTPGENHVTFHARVEDNVAGLFNMLDVFLTALDFVDSLELSGGPVSDVNVFWSFGLSEGSYTCLANRNRCAFGTGIYVLSDPYVSGDTDDFDDDVLLHEFAHHLEGHFGMHDSPGGPHSLIDYQLDLRLAWSEGMASAFASTVKKWMGLNVPERLSIPNSVGEDYASAYIDTQRDKTVISVDLYTASSSFFRFSSNEVAVASGILRLQSQVGMTQTWRALFSGLQLNSTADTMEAFWDALVAYEFPSTDELETWQQILATKKINYQPDQYEPNESALTAPILALNDPQTHTLYQSIYMRDQDWFRLSLTAGQAYSIATTQLTNGADTNMALYRNNLTTPVAENDDEFDCESQNGGCEPLHDGTHFSSKISYTAPATGLYYLKVETAPLVFQDPKNYGYLGRYGGYTLEFSAVTE